MLADVDYFITLPDGKTAILEIKTTNYNARDNWWLDGKETVPVIQDYIRRNPIPATKPYPRRKPTIIILNKANVKRLLKAAYNSGWYLEILIHKTEPSTFNGRLHRILLFQRVRVKFSHMKL